MNTINFNIRAPQLPVICGNERTRDRQLKLREDAYDAMHASGHRYAVAPGCRVTLPGGDVLESGAEVSFDAWDGLPGNSGLLHVLGLVRKGTVLDLDHSRHSSPATSTIPPVLAIDSNPTPTL